MKCDGELDSSAALYPLSRRAVYADFVSRVVYQSLVRIFSYQTSYFLQQEHSELKANSNANFDLNTIDPTENEESESVTSAAKKPLVDLANVTSRDYVSFWSDLLDLHEFVELSGTSSVDKQALVSIIYDELLENMMRIMKKLE